MVSLTYLGPQLALKNEFIEKRQLVAAFGAWMMDHSALLDKILFNNKHSRKSIERYCRDLSIDVLRLKRNQKPRVQDYFDRLPKLSLTNATEPVERSQRNRKSIENFY